MSSHYISNETLAYRLQELEDKFDLLDAKIDKVLELFNVSRKAGKWLLGVAVALGGLIMWFADLKGKF